MSSEVDDVAVGTLDTPVGVLGVAVSRFGLLGVRWGAPERLAARAALPLVHDHRRVVRVLDQLERYFTGSLREFDLTLDWRLAGSAHRPVLETMYETVRYGDSVTYGQLAALSGSAVPARGIGMIMGRNPLPVVVPCHRVLAHDGLGGYSGGSGRDGLEVKRWLLTLEGALPPTLDWDPRGIAVRQAR